MIPSWSHQYHQPPGAGGEWAIHHAAEQGDLNKVINLVMQWRQQQQEDLAQNQGQNMAENRDNRKRKYQLQGPDEIDGKHGRTALMLAVVNCYLPVVDFLLNAGINPNIQDRDGRTALMLATKLHEKKTNHFDYIRLIIEKNADCNIKDKNGRVALLYAAKTGCKRAVEALLPLTNKAVYTDNNGVNPVMAAAARGQLEVLMELYRANLDINSQDNNGTTPLLFAAMTGHTEIVRRLCKFGVDVSHTDKKKRTALMLASAYGYVDIVTLLLKNGQLDPNATDDNGWNALMLAASNGWIGCVKLLSIIATNELRKKAAELANFSYHDHIYTFLINEIDRHSDSAAGKNEKQEHVTEHDQNVSRSATTTYEDSRTSNEWVVGRSVINRNKLENSRYNIMVTGGTTAPLASPMSANCSKISWKSRREKMLDPEAAFDSADPRLKEEILIMIGLYLNEEGLNMSAMTLQDERNLKIIDKQSLRVVARKIYEVITDGDWDTVRKLLRKEMILGKNYRNFLYCLYKQEYLEMITRGETEKAFTFLHKRLKPLESLSKVQGTEKEFQDLCYLLTCKSVTDAGSFRNWDMSSSREQLAETFYTMFTIELDHLMFAASSSELKGNVDAERLVRLLQQAVAYQIEFSEYYDINLNRRSGVTPVVRTLLEDYKNVKVPNRMYSSYVGNTHNVKCVEFVGDAGNLLASGSSNRSIFLWRTQTTELPYDSEDDEDEDELVDEMLNQGRFKPVEPKGAFLAHDSRIWDLSSNKSGTRLASAAGDGSVRLWDVVSCLAASENFQRSRLHHDQSKKSSSLLNSNQGMKFEEIQTYHEGDVYSISFHSNQNYLVSGGYDRTARIIDLETNKVVKTFNGHSGAVTHAIFNPLGNLVITGSKDCTIRFWDLLSGVCVKSFSQPIGEITSIDVNKSGQNILSSSKDSSNRLWDVRAGKCMRRFRGHQNTSRNFIRSVFGPMDALVIGGSEDGRVCIWDTESGDLLQRLGGHIGPVFQTKWNDTNSLLASCSEDGIIKTWYYR